MEVESEGECHHKGAAVASRGDRNIKENHEHAANNQGSKTWGQNFNSSEDWRASSSLAETEAQVFKFTVLVIDVSWRVQGTWDSDLPAEECCFQGFELGMP